MDIYTELTESCWVRTSAVDYFFYVATRLTLPWIPDSHDPTLFMLPCCVLEAFLFNICSSTGPAVEAMSVSSFVMHPDFMTAAIARLQALGCAFSSTTMPLLRNEIMVASMKEPDAPSFVLHVDSFLVVQGNPAVGRLAWTNSIRFGLLKDLQGRFSPVSLWRHV